MNTYSRSLGTTQDLTHVPNALSPALLTDSFVFAPFSGLVTVLHRKSPEFLRIVQLFLPACGQVVLLLVCRLRGERLIASEARVASEEVSHFTVLYA